MFCKICANLTPHLFSYLYIFYCMPLGSILIKYISTAPQRFVNWRLVNRMSGSKIGLPCRYCLDMWKVLHVQIKVGDDLKTLAGIYFFADLNFIVIFEVIFS